MRGFSPGDLIRRSLFYARAVRPRLIERPLWRVRHSNGRFSTPARADLLAAVGDDASRLGEAVPRTVARSFGIGPSSRERIVASLQSCGADLNAIIRAADRTCSREFDVLGSQTFHVGGPIDWHRDFKSGRQWPLELAWKMDYTELDAASDVKVPWELSRCHWVTWLGQAYWLTGESRYAVGFRELIEEWLSANPVGYGVNWSVPMELAIRSVNWIYGIGFFGDSPELADEEFWQALTGSLLWHGRVLRGNLEYERHLGNHYVSNGTGLVALGRLFPRSREGRSWTRKGRRILEQSILWQVHDDGVDYEKSISYHRLVMECFYLPFAWHRAAPDVAPGRYSQAYARRLERMFEFTEAYSRPDGTTPLLSDADDGRVLRLAPGEPITDHRSVLAVGAGLFRRSDFLSATHAVGSDAVVVLPPSDLAALQATTRDVAPRSKAFPAAGYYISRDERSHLILDAGAIGFDGDAIHGHNDTLSLELWVEGTTYLSDSGTFAYTSDAVAHRSMASTAAHNTVRVDGMEIAEISGMWQITEDLTSPVVLQWSQDSTTDQWVAEHHGYSRLDDPVVHRRRVTADKANLHWEVADTLMGRGHHALELFWHFGPHVQIAVLDELTLLARSENGTLRVRCNTALVIEQGWVAPSFGVRLVSTVARAVATAKLPYQFVTEFDYLPRAERASGER
jgi:hypothetical protein